MKNPVTSYNTSTVTCDNFKLYSLYIGTKILETFSGFCLKI